VSRKHENKVVTVIRRLLFRHDILKGELLREPIFVSLFSFCHTLRVSLWPTCHAFILWHVRKVDHERIISLPSFQLRPGKKKDDIRLRSNVGSITIFKVGNKIRIFLQARINGRRSHLRLSCRNKCYTN